LTDNKDSDLHYDHLSYAKDGSKLAYAVRKSDTSFYQIEIVDLRWQSSLPPHQYQKYIYDSRNYENGTHTYSSFYSPALSPDGNWISFAALLNNMPDQKIGYILSGPADPTTGNLTEIVTPDIAFGRTPLQINDISESTLEWGGKSYVALFFSRREIVENNEKKDFIYVNFPVEVGRTFPINWGKEPPQLEGLSPTLSPSKKELAYLSKDGPVLHDFHSDMLNYTFIITRPGETVYGDSASGWGGLWIFPLAEEESPPAGEPVYITKDICWWRPNIRIILSVKDGKIFQFKINELPQEIIIAGKYVISVASD